MQLNKTKSRDTIFFLKKTAKMPRRACTNAIASYLMIFIMLLRWQVIKADKNENTCTLYIAESSMEGVNGVGIFTAKPFKAGSTISPPDSPSVPVCNPWPNSGLVNHYWWGEGKGTSDEMSFECVDYTVDYFVMFGALPNYHPFLKNFDIYMDDIPYDDSLIGTTANPGAGAFSYHGGRKIVANTDIEAGDELFLDYGLDYRNDDYEGHWFEHVPRSRDYRTAGKIMKNSWKQLEAILETIKDAALAKEVIEETLLVIRETATVLGEERVASILPKTKTELDRVAERSHGQMPDLSNALAKEVSIKHRSAEWLVENGRCVDNIIPGKSKLSVAGRGAIAQRFIARGEVVVPVPLIQFMDRDSLILWEEIQNTNGDWDKIPVGQQLLLNYCFGHDESSLLLCPITNSILINHCSNRTKDCGKDGPNTEWRWDTEWDRDTKHWLQMTLEEMDKQEGRGLSFEIIATRDILPGEEIFMDYGISWEEAWEQHVDDWTPAENKRIDSVKQWNDEEGPIKIMSGDLRTRAIHDSITTGCVFWDEFAEDEEGYHEYFEDSEDSDEDYEYSYGDYLDHASFWRYGKDGQRVYRPLVLVEDIDHMCPLDDLWHEMNDEAILWYLGEDGTNFTPANSPRRHSFGGTYWPCSVVRQEENGRYIVEVFPNKKVRGERPLWYEEGFPRFLTNYPRESIRYFPRPNRSDMHLKRAFRHHIDIPDAMFPPQWKDRRETIEHEL